MGIAVIVFAQFAHLCLGAKVNLEVSLPYPIMGTLFFFFLFAGHIICPYWLRPIPKSGKSEVPVFPICRSELSSSLLSKEN